MSARLIQPLTVPYPFDQVTQNQSLLTFRTTRMAPLVTVPVVSSTDRSGAFCALTTTFSPSCWPNALEAGEPAVSNDVISPMARGQRGETCIRVEFIRSV